MKLQVSTYSKPADYSPDNKKLFIHQAHFHSLREIVNYTFADKALCEAEYTVAIFTVRPKAGKEVSND